MDSNQPETRKYTATSFYTVDELSVVLKVTAITIYRYIRDGRLRALKIGRDFRIAERDLDNFLQGLYYKGEPDGSNHVPQRPPQG